MNSAAGTTTPIATTDRNVACNGGGGALGHPQVFLNLGADDEVTCPYCSRVFVKVDANDD